MTLPPETPRCLELSMLAQALILRLVGAGMAANARTSRGNSSARLSAIKPINRSRSRSGWPAPAGSARRFGRTSERRWPIGTLALRLRHES